jgi:agmatine deiminase
MITDTQANTVYLADDFQNECPEEFKRFKSLIEKHNIRVKVLKQTKDRYCRDFMPVQVDEKLLVQFVFNPAGYFDLDQFRYISNPVLAGISNKLPKPIYSKIILDGGNVVKWNDKVIISDKVFADNLYQFKNKEAILKQLEEELLCRVIIIPMYPGDKTGHADGLIRFIDSNRVFINEEEGDDIFEWKNKFLTILNENKLAPTELPCTMKDDQETGDGLYINYLHAGNLVVVPQFGQGHADAKALQIISEVLGNANTVVPYNATTIAEYGGVLNCATWSVKE